MKVVLIDYGAGNLKSVSFALNRLGIEPIISDDPEVIIGADKVIFPGVGRAGMAMDKIVEKGLDRVIPDLKQPVLGICLGMQLLCSETEEDQVKGLGVFETRVVRFPDRVKVPQIGWNTLSELKTALFADVNEQSYGYFVHSYYVPANAETIAVTDYGVRFSAGLRKNNFYGCQFHPEKSGIVGEQILKNFISLCE